MEISNNCIQELYDKFSSFNKCTTKTMAYTICILTMVITMVLFILFYVLHNETLYVIYHFESHQKTLIVTLSCLAHMFVTCLLLLYGLKREKSWCILVWIIVMIIYWNAHLAASVVSIVNYVKEGLETEIQKTSQRTIILFFVQSFWLLKVAFMWYYWRKMKEGNNVANLMQYVTERGSIILSGRSGRPGGYLRRRENSAGPPPSPAVERRI